MDSPCPRLFAAPGKIEKFGLSSLIFGPKIQKTKQPHFTCVAPSFVAIDTHFLLIINLHLCVNFHHSISNGSLTKINGNLPTVHIMKIFLPFLSFYFFVKNICLVIHIFYRIDLKLKIDCKKTNFLQIEYYYINV